MDDDDTIKRKSETFKLLRTLFNKWHRVEDVKFEKNTREEITNLLYEMKPVVTKTHNIGVKYRK